MALSQQTVSPEEKQDALEAVLGSQTFVRSDQLRRFLEFVCGLETAGRADEISEYLVGVEVFGRPDGYSTGDDSIVRSRAHVLRKKLQEFYAEEMPDAPVQIELAKGSYCPRFLKHQPGAIPPTERIRLQGRYRWTALAAAFGCGFLLAGAVFVLLPHPFAGRPSVDATLRDAWGALLDPGAGVLICIATPAQLVVRQRPVVAPDKEKLVLPEDQFRAWYEQRHSLKAGNSLVVHPTHSSPLWGDAAGAARLTQILSRAHVNIELIPERVGQPFVLRGKNVVLFGRPEYSPAAALLLRKGQIDVRYDPESRSHQIFSQDSRQAQSWMRLGIPGRDYGLITVLPSEGPPDKDRRTVVISGVTAAGTLAAADFFSSPSLLLDLQARLRKEGVSGWPRAWQVVVKSESDHSLPLSVAYETHRVLQK